MRFVSRVLFLALCFIFGALAFPMVAQAGLSQSQIDPMTNYAQDKVCNGAPDCSNDTYKRFGNWPGGNDCTNYVSQIANRGPVSQVSQWNYDKNGTPNNISDDSWTDTWNTVSQFTGWFTTDKHYLYWDQEDKTSRYSTAFEGSFYAYNWGTGDGISHVAYSPGYGNYTHFTYNNSNNGNTNYTDDGNHYDDFSSSGDWVDQHAIDRQHSPWNWGWLVEDSATVRANQVFYSLKWN